MNILKNSSGFTLVEIMVAMGLMGVITLGVMSQMKNMAQGQATSEMKVEELEMKRIILSTLSDRNACKTTFQSANIGQSISKIQNSAGTAIYQVGNTYGNKTLKITDIKTEDTGVIQNGTRVVKLHVRIQKMKKIIKANVKDIMIKLNVKAADATSVITDCFSDTEEIINSSIQQACTSIGAVWDTSTGQCQLPGCSSGQILQAITPSGPVCKQIGCTLGQVYVGVDSSGVPVCKTITCSVVGTYFTGLDSSGNPVCVAPTYE